MSWFIEAWNPLAGHAFAVHRNYTFLSPEDEARDAPHLARRARGLRARAARLPANPLRVRGGRPVGDTGTVPTRLPRWPRRRSPFRLAAAVG